MIQIDLLDRDGTVLGEIEGLPEGTRQIAVQRRGPGRGSLVIEHGHTDFAALTERRLIRQSVDGRQFTWMLQRYEDFRVVTDGQDRQVRLWSGDGAWAYYGWGEFHAALVEAPTQTGMLTFGWITADYVRDEPPWQAPTSLGKVSNPTDDLPRAQQVAAGEDGWPDLDAEWLTTRPLTIDGDRASHPAGTSYLHRVLEDVGRTYEGPARLFFSGTNQLDVWWDGRFLGSSFGARNIRQFDVEIVDGIDHAFAGKLSKTAHPGWQWDPLMMRMTIIELTNEGELGRVLYRSYTDDLTTVTPSPGPWLVLDYEDPEGVTATYVASRLIDAAKARGAIPGASYTFTDDAGTDEVALTGRLDIVSYRDGVQLGDVWRQLPQQFGVDLQVAADLELQIFERLGADLSESVVITDESDDTDPEDVGMVDGTVSGSAPKGTVARVQVDGEFGWREDDDAVTAFGRLESAVSLGTAQTVDEVGATVDGVLGDMRGRRLQRLRTSGPAGERPFTNFDVGDDVMVRFVGGQVPARVELIAPVDEPAGVLLFDVMVEV